ncbi:sugar phosphate exchanger 3-like [Dromiciops gliroides]|uniref:sugar phosphate exchanger 3-like n=1 Tax=Dromiciops gliroides TaxID=33562 RepID=UPI001CC61ACE|nr:sugar phosphate exchanger 3-like [Dromiciops gliroides]
MAWPYLSRGTQPLLRRNCRYHMVVFLLTFTSYVLYHASRKAFSSVKVSISSFWILHSTRVYPNSTYFSLNTQQAILLWGTLDTISLFSCAVGLFMNGIVGGWIGLRWLMAIGMCCKGIMTFSFGTLSKWPCFYNKWFYFSLWMFNGLLESTGWPLVVAIMDIWFGITGQGFLLGLWGACASMGNVLGACVSVLLLQYGYEYTFLVTAFMQLTAGLIIIFTICISPEQPAVIYIERESDSEDELERMIMMYGEIDTDGLEENEYYDFVEVVEGQNDLLLRPIVFHEVSPFPEVLLHSLTNACVKLVNYSFFFWLPFYLNSSFGFAEAKVSQFSVWYDLEEIVNGTFQGFLSDVVQKRSMFALCVLLTIGSLVGYNHTPKNKAINALLMSITGLFIGGPSNVTGSVISTGLGCPEQMQGSRKALATGTGIANTTVSIDTAVGQYLVSLIQDKLRWMWVFWFFVLVTACTLLLISVLLLREIRNFVQRRLAPTFRE